jgi:hypothetical protein
MKEFGMDKEIVTIKEIILAMAMGMVRNRRRNRRTMLRL